MRMIVLGDISGIQSYLFDVAEAGGGQARRLRARSFLIQLVAETAALRTLLALGWPADDAHFVLSGAGKFVLQGPDAPGAADRLAAVRRSLNDWLLREARGELRLALSSAAGAESPAEAYRAAQRELQVFKARPWALLTEDGGEWVPGRLMLPPLDTPCSLCGHARAEEDEPHPDTGMPRRVCRWCAANLRLGRILPQARWLVVEQAAEGADFELFGLGVTVATEDRISVGPNTMAVANLREPDQRPTWCPADRFLKRRLMAHVPSTDGRPTWFVDIAARARGDHLLGVLKADADSLGSAMDALLGGSTDLQPLAAFSRELDEFFAGALKEEIESGRDPRWRWIYTIFAGGDDLIMVGPWDVMLDFASCLRELFQAQFGDRGLTISAGLALIKPKRPIKGAVAEADHLLEQAKTRPALAEALSKDQLACFGQVWKWDKHEPLLRIARQLVGWCEDGDVERGWLHTLLGLAVARHPSVFLDRAGVLAPPPDLLATARLAYHVARNYRPKTAARDWAERLVERFDNPRIEEVRYLPAIVRYALTATRSRDEEE